MQKVLIANSISIVMLIMTFLFISCNASKDAIENEDYTILKQILIKNKKQNPESNTILKITNSNEYLISIIKELKEYEASGNRSGLDSLKKSLDINEDEVYKSIFNYQEYDNLISQSQNSKWNFTKINLSEIQTDEENKFISQENTITISKPIYTSENKFALVLINRITSSYILILKRDNENWIEDKLIAPRLISPKAVYKKP